MRSRVPPALLIAFTLAGGVRAADPSPAAPVDAAGVRHLGFSADPHWEGLANRILPDPLPIVRQDFGYGDAGHAKGKTKGEIGGRIQRSPTPCSYARVIEPKSFNYRLSASGRFAVTAADGNGGLMFGWFNAAESRGWRTNHSIALRLDANGLKYRAFVEYGSRHWLGGGKGCFEGERWQTTKTRPMLADGTPHDWTLDYDPAGAGGNGLVTATLDGERYELPLAAGVRADGATFDRFGLFDAMIPGGAMDAYFADLSLAGKPLVDLRPEAGWEGRSNRGEYRERIVAGHHDFGFSPNTAHAGGKPGEIGGVIWHRVDPPAHYADRVGQFSLKDELSASGTIAFLGAGSDSGVYFGWFDAASRVAKKTEEGVETPKNLLGVMIEGPSRVGHYFRPACRTADGRGGPAESGPLIRPDGQVHQWAIRYAPTAAEGRGRITVTFDGKDQVLELAKGLKERGATFDRFGIFAQQQGGQYVEVYLDDLAYTAGRAKN